MTNSTAVTPETLPAIVWQNQPVITTELLAEIYGTVTDNISQNFTRNATRFIEGVHYFLLKGADLKEFKTNLLKEGQLQIGKRAAQLFLWTERGTVRHAKILDTNEAWAVQDRLEDFYFSRHQPKDAPLPFSIAEEKIICYMKTLVEIYDGWFINEYGEKTQIALPILTWGSSLVKLTPEQFERGLDKCKQSKSKFLPKLQVFLSYCHNGELLEPLKAEYQPPEGMELIQKEELKALHEAAMLPPDLQDTIRKAYEEIHQLKYPSEHETIVTKQRLGELEFIAHHAAIIA